jgi:diacylglycerol kinase (ATP)
MMMAPGADTADGLVEGIIGKAMSRRKLLAAFPRIFSGTHVALPVIEALRAREIEFDADAPLDLMIDGEVERHRPLRLSVLPHALDVSV